MPGVKIAAADATDERAHEHLARSRVGAGRFSIWKPPFWKTAARIVALPVDAAGLGLAAEAGQT